MEKYHLKGTEGLVLHCALVEAAKNDTRLRQMEIWRRICALPSVTTVREVRETLDRFMDARIISCHGRHPRRIAVSADGFWLAARGSKIYAGRQGYVCPAPYTARATNTRKQMRELDESLFAVSPTLLELYRKEATCSSSE